MDQGFSTFVQTSAHEQPFTYPLQREFVEPDWTRLPGYRHVSRSEWENASWQRGHTIKRISDLKQVLGPFLTDELAADIERDQHELATMPMLITPHMINTMDERDLVVDPIRLYMIPAFSDRNTRSPSHPKARRDSLGEAEMWVVEGLVHRYPTKVLAEIIATCPQYCGHCTRMNLVGNNTARVNKYRFQLRPLDRLNAMLEYIRQTPSIRDVVVSGGDVANAPLGLLERFVSALVDIPHIRDLRLASKALISLPQHFLQPQVVAAMERLANKAQKRRVNLALHTHANHANQITPLVARAAHQLLDAGFHELRNQGVLLRGVNATPSDLLDLCFMLVDHTGITPYYFYMCDIIPHVEHWRIALWEAQGLQHAIIGYLPGYATPRLVCDVPFAGKQWVHQVDTYDRERGISYWTKNYRTNIERGDLTALTRKYEYYDPIYTLPESWQQWWANAQQPILSAR